MIVWLLNRVQIIMANGEIAHYLLLPQRFQKPSAAEASESVCMRERVNPLFPKYKKSATDKVENINSNSKVNIYKLMIIY